MMDGEYYYYLRDRKNRPIVTVCLVKSAKDIARGIAICSPRDMPRKKTGRNIARGRAMFALQNQKEEALPVIRKEPMLVLCLLSAFIPQLCLLSAFIPQYWLKRKAWFNPELTEYEKEITKEDRNA